MVFAEMGPGLSGLVLRIENCGGGTISSRYGLVDIPDRYQPPDLYLDECLLTGVEDGEKFRSVAFWCDGLHSGGKD